MHRNRPLRAANRLPVRTPNRKSHNRAEKPVTIAEATRGIADVVSRAAVDAGRGRNPTTSRPGSRTASSRAGTKMANVVNGMISRAAAAGDSSRGPAAVVADRGVYGSAR
ncbi:MAG: hypothetical protein ACREH8_18510 [Opitutaceae bacterium]